MSRFTRHQQQILVVGLAILAAAVLGGVVGFGGALGVAAVAVLLLLGTVIWKPELAFIASIVTIVAGQLVRLPILGDDAGVLMNDIILPPLLLIWVVKRLLSGHWHLPRQSLTLPVLGVIVAMAISLLANYHQYDATELLSGALYQVRWLEYTAVLLMGFDFFRTRTRVWRYFGLMVGCGLVVSLLGFVQLQIFPDFSFMAPAGWDPHVGRLLSTWFDPNFLAGWLAFLISVCLGVALGLPWARAKWWWGAIIVMTAAVVLTFSRSGYLALVVGTAFVTMIRSRSIFFLGLIAIVATIFFVPRVQERVIGIRTVDETAQLRILSWENAFSVITEHPWTGVGYNLYQYVQVEYGFLDDTKIHSASGSDSSLLSIWVTTGIFGLLAYLWLLIAMLREAWKTWRARELTREWQGFGLGVFAGLLALIIHAQFVNGLFYPHLMHTIWIFIAMVIMVRQPHADA